MQNDNDVQLGSKLTSRKMEMNLEALRGAAALIVVWSHAVVFSDVLSPNYQIKGWAASEPPARISVFLFFVLSGFVIGISNKKRLEIATIKIYIKKRFFRIYPIYFITVFFTLLISKPYPLATDIANLTFLQVAFANVIAENSPIWSLNYEVLYYSIFIVISFCRFNYFLAFLIAFTVGVLNILLFPSNTLLSSYSFGLATWIVGLIVARATQDSPVGETNCQVLVGIVLIICSFRYFNVLDTLLLKVTHLLVGNHLEYGAIRGYREMVNFSDFSYVPYFILFILVFTNKKFYFDKSIKNILFLLPALTFYYLYKNRAQVNTEQFVQPGVFYLLGITLIYLRVTWLTVFSRYVIKILIKIGSISYGLYIIHMPLLVLIGKIPTFTSPVPMYFFKLVLLLTSSLFLAHILELKFQPYIHARFYPSFRPVI